MPLYVRGDGSIARGVAPPRQGRTWGEIAVLCVVAALAAASLLHAALRRCGAAFDAPALTLSLAFVAAFQLPQRRGERPGWRNRTLSRCVARHGGADAHLLSECVEAVVKGPGELV